MSRVTCKWFGRCSIVGPGLVVTGGRGRGGGFGSALATGTGASAPGDGARSWGGDESPIYGAACGRIGWRGRGHVSIPVSVHGNTAADSRRSRSSDGDGRGCGSSGCGGSSWLAVVGGRQVNGRTNDFAGCGTASTGWGARIGVLWISTAPARPAGNETSGPPCEGFDANAVHARNARYIC